MLNNIIKHSKLILTWAIIFGVLSGVVSLVFPKQYSADSQVLIISRDRTGVDPYTQAKSAERIGQNLVQIMKTADFYSKVFELNGASLNADQWKNLSERRQRKKWSKDVLGNMVYGTGLLNVRAYAPTKEQAVALSSAVSQTLGSNGWEYVGGDVSIRVVTTPLASRLPARPNVAVNILLGFAAGILIAVLWVIRKGQANIARSHNPSNII